MCIRFYSKPLYDHKLRNAQKTKNFSFEGKKYLAKIVDVYDGDTITAVIRRRGKLEQHKIRLINLDTPEMKPPIDSINREAQIKSACDAKDALIAKLVETKYLVTLECHEFDKYGRILATVHTRPGWFKSSINLNEWMVENQYGREYDGGKKGEAPS